MNLLYIELGLVLGRKEITETKKPFSFTSSHLFRRIFARAMHCNVGGGRQFVLGCNNIHLLILPIF